METPMQANTSFNYSANGLSQNRTINEQSRVEHNTAGQRRERREERGERREERGERREEKQGKADKKEKKKKKEERRGEERRLEYINRI